MATNSFYYYEGKKIPLTPSLNKQAVHFDNPPTEQMQNRLATVMGRGVGLVGGEDLGNGIVLYERAPTSLPLNASAVASTNLSAKELAVFDAPNQSLLIVTDEFIARFKSQVSRPQIEEFNRQNGVRIVRENEYEPNAFVLSVPHSSRVDAVKMANRYQESDLVDYAHPNFTRIVSPDFVPNDTMFAQQWALQNTGQGAVSLGKTSRQYPLGILPVGVRPSSLLFWTRESIRRIPI